MATKKGKKKKKQGFDTLTFAVVGIAVILLIVLLINLNKDKKKDGKQNGTPAPMSVTPGKVTEPLTPTKGQAETKPTAPPTSTPTLTSEPTKPPVLLDQKEAETAIQNKVELSEYTIELLDDHLSLDGAEYFSFCISDVATGDAYEPLLLVHKVSGEVCCLVDGVVAPCEKFPLDSTESKSEETEEKSAEWVRRQLLACSKERLSLPKEVGAYTLRVDEWSTILHGKEYFGVDVLDTSGDVEKRLGLFYVEMETGRVYSLNDVADELIER